MNPNTQPSPSSSELEKAIGYVKSRLNWYSRNHFNDYPEAHAMLVKVVDAAKQVSELQEKLNESNKSYQTVKDWGHRLEGLLITLLEEFDNHADGTPDATPLERFCNEMIGKYNDISLGQLQTLQQQLRSKDELIEKLVKVLENSKHEYMGSVRDVWFIERDKTLTLAREQGFPKNTQTT